MFCVIMLYYVIVCTSTWQCRTMPCISDDASITDKSSSSRSTCRMMTVRCSRVLCVSKHHCSIHIACTVCATYITLSCAESNITKWNVGSARNLGCIGLGYHILGDPTIYYIIIRYYYSHAVVKCITIYFALLSKPISSVQQHKDHVCFLLSLCSISVPLL